MDRIGSAGGHGYRIPPIAPRVTRFPGPVVVADQVPAGMIALPGFEDSDGRPWSIQVSYTDPNDERRQVTVRTTRGSLDWTPVIRTVENIYTVMRNCSVRPVEPVVEEPTTAEVGGERVCAIRIACHHGRSGVAFEWRGQHVYVVGTGELIDCLKLRRGDVADFEAYAAAHLARYGRSAQ